MPNYTDREIRVQNFVETTTLVLLVVVTFVFMWIWNRYQPLRERTAYKEGVREAERRAEAAGGWEAWCADTVRNMKETR